MTRDQHAARLALLRTHTTGRKQTRAADDFYEFVVTVRPGADDPQSHVARAADAVFALIDANAVSSGKGCRQLAALLDAWRTLR